MTPENIMYWIDLVVLPEEFNRQERNMLKRYFIRKLIPWMPLRAIATITEVTNHTTVLWSIKKVKTDQRFRYVLPTLEIFINDICATLRYTPKL
jgi:hypothetical protein